MRRVVAAALVGLAAWSALTVIAPPAPSPGRAVVTVTRDLPAGHVLEASDVAVVHPPPGVVPETAYADPAETAGRALVGSVAEGEVLTPARVRTAGLLQGLGPDQRAVHLTVADPASLAAIAPGDRVDVVATTGDVIAQDVLVIGTDPVSSDSTPRLVSSSAAGGGVTVALRASVVGDTVRRAVNDTPGGGIHLALRPMEPRYSSGRSAAPTG